MHEIGNCWKFLLKQTVIQVWEYLIIIKNSQGPTGYLLSYVTAYSSYLKYLFANFPYIISPGTLLIVYCETNKDCTVYTVYIY